MDNDNSTINDELDEAEFRKYWAETLYDGDMNAFDENFDYFIHSGQGGCLPWDDLVNEETILPKLADAANQLIENRLGYLPRRDVTVRFSTELRKLIDDRRRGFMITEDYEEQAEHVIKKIRNRDYRHNTQLKYSQDIFDTYWNIYTAQRHMVRDRLTKFLGYAPDLQHSIVGELIMQNSFASDTIQFPDFPTWMDFKVIGLIKYREVLLSEGKDAADLSSLYGIGGFTV